MDSFLVIALKAMLSEFQCIEINFAMLRPAGLVNFRRAGQGTALRATRFPLVSSFIFKLCTGFQIIK